MEFHVHTYASQLVIGVISTQNPIGQIDQLVMYSLRLSNFVERNYTIMERKALAMVNALHKSRHYLLGNIFTSYVDHINLVSLVNKPQVFDRLVKWLLLFLEYDFKIDYKLSRSQLMANVLSWLPN